MSSSHNIQALIKNLYPFDYRMNGLGNDEAIHVYKRELDFQVHEFAEEEILNGWPVPRSEVVKKANIWKKDSLIYDGLASPLGTILSTAAFEGELSLEELKAHLYYHTENETAIPFHCTQQYRVGQKNWGFCMPRTLYDSLEEGSYKVEIEVEHRPTSMKALEYVLPGESEYSIVIQAHNCHPYQANDDMSGCAVGIRLLQELKKKQKRKYTYRLLISPELTGTLFWLHQSCRNPEKIKGAIILPVVGNDADLKLQCSFTGNSFLDLAAHEVFTKRFGQYESGGFRRLYGNDETVFEAPGFEIPTISLTRYPFPFYHSDLDTPENVSEDRLADTLETLLDIVNFVEEDPMLTFIGKGLYCLSHPDYDLYKRVWDPSQRDGPRNRDEGRNWNLLMTELPRRLDGKTSLHTIARLYNLPFDEVREYCLTWVDKGLVEKVG